MNKWTFIHLSNYWWGKWSPPWRRVCSWSAVQPGSSLGQYSLCTMISLLTYGIWVVGMDIKKQKTLKKVNPLVQAPRSGTSGGHFMFPAVLWAQFGYVLGHLLKCDVPTWIERELFLYISHTESLSFPGGDLVLFTLSILLGTRPVAQCPTS